MVIKFFHKAFTRQNPKPLMDHMQRMASREAPFFLATLSLVISTLARKVIPQPITSDSRLGNLVKLGIRVSLKLPLQFTHRPPPLTLIHPHPQYHSVLHFASSCFCLWPIGHRNPPSIVNLSSTRPNWNFGELYTSLHCPHKSKH